MDSTPDFCYIDSRDGCGQGRTVYLRLATVIQEQSDDSNA
jgi:hypothetical protein